MSSQNFVPRSGGLRSRWHVLGHFLLLVAGWAIFALSWWDVLRQPWETQTLRHLIIGAIVVMPSVTIAWILHNRRIHQRLGPRKAVPAVPLRYEIDFNGRRIEADWPVLQQTRYVVIERGQATKRYVPVQPTQLPAVEAHEPPGPTGSAAVL